MNSNACAFRLILIPLMSELEAALLSLILVGTPFLSSKLLQNMTLSMHTIYTTCMRL